MNPCYLSDEDIRGLDRDIRILIATDGTLTRMLNIVANDEIVLQIIKQEICNIAPTEPESEELPNRRVLKRHTVLSGRSSGTAYIAAEALIAIDHLPPSIITDLTKTERPIGEVMAASGLETFKETATVWKGALPGWVVTAGNHDARIGHIARRYRVIVGGQRAIIITEYFLQNVFSDGLQAHHDRGQHSDILHARSKKSICTK